MSIQLPGESNAMIGERSAGAQRQIVSTAEKIDMLVSKMERALGKKHFNPTVGPVLQEFLRSFARQTREHFRTAFVINRSAIVGIDQRKIPNFASLINVRHARRS